MSTESQPSDTPEMPKVYLLPNLMTAGNLFCGFMAIREIIAGTLEQQVNGLWIRHYDICLTYILAAFIFDMLDGRLARLGGRDSAFGREFDSLADVVSFGLAPALLVLKIILADLPEDFHWVGWMVAFGYLLAGAMRLARFNVVASQPQIHKGKDFIGFPIPAAAGTVASLTLFILSMERHDVAQPGPWKYLLPLLLVGLSLMMYSRIEYPSFKTMDWKSKRPLPQVLLTFLLLVVIWKTYEKSLAVVFLSYLVYGFVRPHISKRIRQNIEEEEEDSSDGSPS